MWRFWKQPAPAPRRAPKRPRPVRHRLAVEALEGREVLSSAVGYEVGEVPLTLTAADFNGDGIADLAVVNHGSDDVSVLLGGPDGLRPAGRYAAGPRPVAAAAADFNGDGALDLVLTSAADGGGPLFLLAGNGDGSFREPVALQPPRPHPWAVVTADLNQDKVPDLVLTHAGGSVSTLLGVGDGSFRPGGVHDGRGAVTVAVGDFDEDGRLDLAAADDAGLWLLQGAGDGTFREAGHQPLPRAWGLAAGHLNGDGRLDLVAATAEGRLAVGLNTGRGGFAFHDGDLCPMPPCPGPGPGPCPWPWALALADLDSDGRLDVAASDYESGVVWVGLGQGDGRFRDGGRFLPGDGATGVAVADFVGSGSPHIAVVHSSASAVNVMDNPVASTILVNPAPILQYRPLFSSGGDRDFDGHGPDTSITVSLSFSGSRLYATYSAWFRETKHDYTFFLGTRVTELYDVSLAHPGRSIVAIESPSFFEFRTEDTDHEVNDYYFGAYQVVWRLSIQGDTFQWWGSDDPWVSIYFNGVTLRLS